MGILIGIIIGIIVIAGIGAGVYIVIFRAKHKKEVENSQVGAVPVFGDTSGGFNTEGQPEQPMGSVFDTPPDQGPQTGGAVMNDITQGPAQPANISSAPQPSPAPASNNAFQPAINHDFPDNNIPEAPQGMDSASETGGLEQTQETLGDTFAVGHDNNTSQTNSTILDDNPGLSGSVADIAQTTQDTATDSGIEDSKVPVTENETTMSDTAGQPAPDSIGSQAVPENIGESYTVPLETTTEPSVPTPVDSATPEPAPFAPSQVSEPMQASEAPFQTANPSAQTTVPPVPEAPVEPSTDSAPVRPTSEKPEPPHMEI